MGESKKCAVVLILHDIRSAHNVGSLFRTADGVGVDEIILSGYTPVPPRKDALYLTDADKALRKTALGAEESVFWKKAVSLPRLLTRLQKDGYELVALEQDERSVDYRTYRPAQKVALLVGNEVGGVEQAHLKRCDTILEIPMAGAKNSLNVSVAAGIALYQIIGTMKR
ncbi:MAG: RNA methyltransferase [Candidatus Moranbacteria bacterium]|jgi:tRNA G18 (ribose-2'-O)-methylase SpoU|nr:RNA methyltransferase [Candidatus Moranbacteria bacterium]